MPEEIRPIGPGRFAIEVTMPWGARVEAEMVVTTEKGWRERPESRDDRWTVYSAGPAVMAVRLVGEVPVMRRELPRSRVPAEWN